MIRKIQEGRRSTLNASLSNKEKAMTVDVKNFGAFISALAQNNGEAASNDVLEAISKELQEKKKAQIKAKLEALFSQQQAYVETLKDLRRQETKVKNKMTDVENLANKVVAGEDDVDEDWIKVLGYKPSFR